LDFTKPAVSAQRLTAVAVLWGGIQQSQYTHRSKEADFACQILILFSMWSYHPLKFAYFILWRIMCSA